ncbi:MAG: heavy metal sensor histidine kinase [Betaproteobacteria bacterium]|nr:heavy metal sensor histidine kinase [Betaproteobacteria bacterium]
MSLNRADLSRSRAPLSITARLTMLYAASAAVLLLVTTAFFYWIQLQSMERDDFYFVIDKVLRLEQTLKEHPGDLRVLEREIRWGSEAHEREQSHTFYSRIFDGRGRLVIESEGMASLAPSAQLPPPVDPERVSEPGGVQRWHSPDGRIYCVLSTRAQIQPGEQPWVIQVAMDDAEDEKLVANQGRAALMVLLLGTLVAAGLGGAITHRGMKPLREIAAAAERISAHQLTERIDAARQPKELTALATSLNRMLCRLQGSFARMSQFAADLAHELRQPIHNMMGEAEVALSADRKPEEYRGILESSLEEFERMTRMINEMLFLARAENPEQQIERQRLDARREIDAVKEFFDALIESSGVRVTTQGLGEIDADPLLFRRAVTNLLANALHHTPRGGTIVLSVEQADDGTVRVKVADSGVGIPSEQLPRIFERLNRSDRTPAEVSEHTGLGLSIVKSIVELHGGSIMINSAPGKGTTVLMRFPVPAPAVASPEQASAPALPDRPVRRQSSAHGPEAQAQG